METMLSRNIEKTLLKAVSEGNAAGLKNLLDLYTVISEDSSDIICDLKMHLNCKDEKGLSPLQISASLGFSEICELLINRGGDIDISSENCPSPLMLAATNNHYDVVSLLLERKTIVSSYYPDHMAAEEAALKGHKEIEQLINIHIIARALDFYFKTAEIEDYGFLQNCLYDLLINDNKHPVRLIMNLRKNTAMVSEENINRVTAALRGLRDQQYHFFKNEKLSWMCHGIAYFFSLAAISLNDAKSDKNTMRASDEEILDGLIETWLRHQPKNGYSQRLLRHMQAAIYRYPFRDSKMYKIMTSAKLNEFSKEHLLFSTCETCRNSYGIQLCQRCENVTYCNSECLLLHWPVHKTECNSSHII